MATLAFARDAQPWQRSLRWTRPAPDRRAVALGIVLALLLTAIEVGLFDVAMRREVARAGHAPPDRVLQVDLIEEKRPVEPPAVAPTPLLPRPIPHEPRAHARVAPRASSRETGSRPTAPQEKPRLFGLDGRILLPDDHAEKGTPDALSPRVVRGDAFARVNPVPYQATRFDRYFPDVRETLGGEVVRKTTVTFSWRTPWGTVWECRSSLLLLGIGGCTWGPAPTLTIEELKALRADPPPSPSLAPAPVPPATGDPPQQVQP